MKTKGKHKNKINVITLGCSKNIVDSENIITQLRANDYEVDHENTQLDHNIVIINTCGFIDRAKEESVNTILEYADIKNQGEIDKLYVTGCLSQRYKDDLEKEIPEVDAYFGTMELPSLLHTLNADYKHDLIGERLITTPDHYAYLKISEGCNRTCSFCAIPLMRGKHVSKPIEELIREARHLASHGVKELILIAQELTYYGLDLYKKRTLPELLTQLAAVPGIEWIRLHYAYPSKFPVEVIEVMRDVPQVCNYLDMPLQHAADPILDRMKRQISLPDTRRLIQDIRRLNEAIAIRTTMMVGFPGETNEHFTQLEDFIKEMEFDRLGVFTYSHEENTSAHNFPDDVPVQTKTERFNRLMELQEDISWRKNQLLLGKTLKVLIDRKEGDFFIGRTEYDSPEVDNEVLIKADENYVRVGDFAQVLIEEAHEFDLVGRKIK